MFPYRFIRLIDLTRTMPTAEGDTISFRSSWGFSKDFYNKWSMPGILAGNAWDLPWHTDLFIGSVRRSWDAARGCVVSEAGGAAEAVRNSR